MIKIKDIASNGAVRWGAIAEKIDNNFSEISGSLNAIDQKIEEVEAKIPSGGTGGGGYTAMPVVEHDSDENRATITPNVFHKWSGSMSSLTIELGTPTSGVVNQYVFQFAGYSGTTLSIPSSVNWENNEPPVIDGYYLYQVSIINNLATYVKYKYF